MYRSHTIFAFLLLSAIFTFADELEYVWPTDASQLFSSSFAESRGGRFHAGVDVKTWGVTGYPIYAVRDGHISRIRVSPFGYGRALYLTLDTGEIVVYGHLEKFNDEIEVYVKAEQKKRNNYDIQLYPAQSQFPVKQGDLIALSGDSGVGYPHLHFEMRDAASNPINPLLKGYTVIDNIPPRITKILLQPLDALSSVDGDFKPKLFWPVTFDNQSYRINDPIVVSGRIGFGIGTFDQMDSVNNKFGTYRNELYINDTLVFSTQYDKFSYAINNHFNLDRDYRQRMYGNGYIYNLFRDYSNKLSFYSSRELYAGVLDFKNGSHLHTSAIEPADIVEIPPGVSKLDNSSHTFKISVQDYWGNRSEITGRLIVDGVDLVPSDEPTPVDTVYGPAPPNSALIFHDNDKTDFKDIRMYTRFYDRYIRIQLSSRLSLADTPVVSGWLCSGKTYAMPLLKKSATSFVGAWPLSGCNQGPLPLSITYVTHAGDTLIQNEWIEFTTIPRGQRKTVLSKDGLCKLDFTENSLFKDIFVRTRSLLPLDSNRYEIVGNKYQIFPNDVPLNKGVTISLVYPENDSLPGKLGIYYAAGEKMRFAGNKRNPNDRRISAHINFFATYALVRDVDPPKIYSLSPADGAHTTDSTPKLRSTFGDELSGIAGEANRILKLDGKKVIAEYDPEALAIFYTPEEPLNKGEHSVEIVLRDRSANFSSRKHTFFID